MSVCDTCPNKEECREMIKQGVVIPCERQSEIEVKLGTTITSDRITDGYKHDGGKPRLDLVPPEIIIAVVTVMTHGAEKYGEGNYRKVEPKRYRAALMRHICKWLKDPHGVDADSGLPHLYHIACNVAFLLELDKKPKSISAVIKENLYKERCE